MSTVTCRLGFGAVKGSKSVVILSKCRPVVDNRIASISSKIIRDLDPKPKPKPWPYKEKGYSNFHAYFDGTMKRFDENTVIITVEGPPAVGKSVFARQLAHDLDMLYLPMVTADYAYIDPYGMDFRENDPKLPPSAQSIDIEKFVQDPKGINAPVFQFQNQTIKLSQYFDALAHVFNTGQGVVLERCFWTDQAFMEANLRNGYNNKTEVKGYYKRKAKIDGKFMRPHLGIYLDARPETVLENLKKRGMGEEKVFHKKYLEDLDEMHKQQTLIEFEKHSELLIYDWNEPGDVEAVVEDIERMDWTKYEKHDDKIKGWRWLDDREACQERWEVTNNKLGWMTTYYTTSLFDCPRLWQDAETVIAYNDVQDEFKSTKYAVGFNPEMGDNVWWKFERKPRAVLPDVVTKMLIDKVPAPKTSTA